MDPFLPGKKTLTFKALLKILLVFQFSFGFSLWI